MSEAWGSIVIKVPEDIADLFLDDDDVSVSTLDALFEYADIEPVASYPDIPVVESYSLEEDPTYDDDEYLLLHVFGSEWMEVIKALVTYGEHIELYGSIEDEYQIIEYYSLNDLGERYFDVHDGQSAGSSVDAKLAWLDTIAADVLEEYSGVLDSDDDDVPDDDDPDAFDDADDDDDLDDDDDYDDDDDDDEFDEDDDEDEFDEDDDEDDDR